jgi:hypothetical protein
MEFFQPLDTWGKKRMTLLARTKEAAYEELHVM